MTFKYGFLILILMQLTLTGCGDLFGKKVVKPEMGGTRWKANCEMDMDSFADILEKDITGTIDCLEKNLNIFIEVSELGRGGKLSRVALKNYLKRNRPETKPQSFAIIDAVFSLAHLITAEDKDFVSKKNVEVIVQLVRSFNLHAFRHYKHTFRSEAPATLSVHESHRRRVEDAANDIKSYLMQIYRSDRNGEIHFLDIMKLATSFVKEGDEETLEKIDGMLWVKKIIAGGEPRMINHKELGFLFEHLPKLLSLVLDVVRYEHLELDQRDMLTFIKEDVQDLANILFHPNRGDRRYEPMVNVDQGIDAIDRFIEEEDDKLAKYRVLIKEVKFILTKDRNTPPTPEEDWITGKDLEKMFNHAFNMTARGLAFHKFYNHPDIKAQLDLPQSVYLDPKKYEIDFPMDKADLVEFCRIINSYRYMKGSFDMTYYSLDYRRNSNGPAEISLYEYVIKRAMAYFTGGSYSIANEALQAILKRFENELVELDIVLPRRAKNTGETIALLGSLFQSQSDDNKVLDVDEATEFAITIFSSMDTKKEFMDFLVNEKQCEVETFGKIRRVDPTCFNANFWEGLCVRHRKNFPRLMEFLGDDPSKSCEEQNYNNTHNLDYLVASAKAARFCHVYPSDKSEVYYSEGDIMSILTAMMHIETTITRWDTRTINNTMDPNEVMDAYSIYKPAIEGMLPPLPGPLNTPKIKELLAKQVYLYLVKFEDQPLKETNLTEVWKLIKFLTSANQKKAPAHRKTIASILRIVSEQSAAKAKKAWEERQPGAERPFDCECVRNPDPEAVRDCLAAGDE